MNNKALTNQIEYIIYNQKKEIMELSDCENIKVKVHYNIKDNSNLNKSMILNLFLVRVPFFYIQKNKKY